MLFLIHLALTYLAAAVPYGLLITLLYGGDADVREEGSGNIGTTNVARLHGWRLAVAVLLLDIGKGLLPVLAARLLWPDAGVIALAAVAITAFVGHCFPVYLAFRGGKGVATAAGAMLAIAPDATLLAMLAWGLLLAGTGRSSVASLGAVASLVAAAFWLAPAALPIGAALAVGIVATHTANVRRLVRGEEKAVITPVRWGRPRSDAPDVEALLHSPPAGVSPIALPDEGRDDGRTKAAQPSDAGR